MANGGATRRQFLAIAAGGSVFVVAACSDDGAEDSASPTTEAPSDSPTTHLDGPVVDDYWDLLREAQRRVRTSPDHVLPRLEALAAEGDVAGMVEYARTHFAVLPVDPRGWISLRDGQRWGTRGVVRSRMGTPREIAQLLAEVLTANGIEASVVVLPLLDDVRPLLVPAESPEFAPIDPVEELFELGETSEAAGPDTVDISTVVPITSEALKALGSEFFDVDAPPELTPQGLPTVQFDDGGTPTVADLWTKAGGVIGIDSPSDAGEVAATASAEFTLSIATQATLRDPVDVATASFAISDLAGRRVDARFLPPAADLTELLTTRPADVTTFVPQISVNGDLDDEAGDLSITGTPITLEGDLLETDADGFLTSSGRIGGDGDATEAVEIRINRVASGNYPRLSVELDILDSGSRSVTDLGADAFSVLDNGVAVPFLLRRSEPPRPSIVFIVDNSSSVPDQYRNEGATRVVGGIARAIKAEFPDARFRVANVGPAGAGSLAWRDDPEVVADDADQFGIGSGLWNSYVDAAALGGNSIVFLTDGIASTPEGDPQDQAPEELLAALRSGPAAIMLGTGELGAAFQGIADITGGVTLDIDDQDAAVAAVLDQLSLVLTPYDFLVLADDDADGAAPPDEEELRSLSVSLVATGLDNVAPYARPPGSDTSTGPAVVGIYLTINANGVKVTRTLAGVPHRTEAEVTPEIVQEVRQALFGNYSVITEAGAPSAAQILDDNLEAMLSWEPFFAAADSQEAIEAYAAGRELPHGAHAFSVPVSGSDVLTWETGLRMWLSTERTLPRGDVDVVRRSVDLLPTSRFVTATDDAVESVRLTAQRTAVLSAIEATLYDTAALDRLVGPLEVLAIGDLEPEQRALYDQMTAGWSVYSGFASNEALDAAVAVDRTNGTLIAVLPDGSGGGITEAEIKERFKQAISLVEMADTAGAPGAWAKLEKAKLEALRFATLVIFRMSVDGIIETLTEEVCSRVINKKANAWGLAGLRRVSPEAGGMLGFAFEEAKLVNRWGSAAGLPPNLPDKFKIC